MGRRGDEETFPELLPFVEQKVAKEDVIQPGGFEHAGLDELQDAGEILSPAGLQSDGGEMFRTHHGDGYAIHLVNSGGGDGLFFQGADGGQKLHGPIANDDVFALRFMPPAQEILIDRAENQQGTLSAGRQQHKHIHMQGGDRFEVKRRANGSSDGIASDNAFGLHPVEHEEDVFHDGISGTTIESGVQLQPQLA